VKKKKSNFTEGYIVHRYIVTDDVRKKPLKKVQSKFLFSKQKTITGVHLTENFKLKKTYVPVFKHRVQKHFLKKETYNINAESVIFKTEDDARFFILSEYRKFKKLKSKKRQKFNFNIQQFRGKVSVSKKGFGFLSKGVISKASRSMSILRKDKNEVFADEWNRVFNELTVFEQYNPNEFEGRRKEKKNGRRKKRINIKRRRRNSGKHSKNIKTKNVDSYRRSKEVYKKKN